MFGKSKNQLKKKNITEQGVEMKKVLINAIRMQALYSNGKIRIFETSNLIN